jgi:chemotaxis protein methyltransferase CheR
MLATSPTAAAARAVAPSARFAAAASDPGRAPESREFTWTDRDFERVRKLIYQRAGISLQEGKHAMVYSRLARRLRDTGHSSFTEYLDWLEKHDGAEWQEFTNSLTTNLTAFFREAHHFEVLAAEMARQPKKNPWKIWCSAASTGEEPYSILMTAQEALGANAPVQLLASDIDTRVLETAARGVYQLDNIKGLSQERLQRFFLRGKGTNAGMVRVRPELQQAVRFTTVNLIGDEYNFKTLFDVVFCRNVMIYFDRPTQRKVLERIHRVMEPGGLLFVGHSENFNDARDLFSLRGKTVYERC